ncbi:hypothetical protein [Actinospica sp.]|uniref:hypothetical protein n=1 Tax=Actinospica sp. TaxID=1872142 RepID=UPI002D03BDD4|nr:hypothetical protein [Actinospica sp.]HWG24104.1 hypothetical protein [Actinospica sp.]
MPGALVVATSDVPVTDAAPADDTDAAKITIAVHAVTESSRIRIWPPRPRDYADPLIGYEH